MTVKSYVKFPVKVSLGTPEPFQSFFGDVSNCMGPVLGHKRRKLVFLTSEEPQELDISPRASLSIQFVCVKLSIRYKTFSVRARTQMEAPFEGPVLGHKKSGPNSLY